MERSSRNGNRLETVLQAHRLSGKGDGEAGKARLLRTHADYPHGQKKDNLAKFFWDMAKVALTLLFVTPLAQTGGPTLYQSVLGLVTTFLLGLVGWLLRWTGGQIMDAPTIVFVIAALIGLGGIFIALFDKGLKWKDRS